jgi:ENTH domain
MEIHAVVCYLIAKCLVLLTFSSLHNSFNQAKPKSEFEARVYEALSHKNWGTSSTLMNEIARDTYDHDKCRSFVWLLLIVAYILKAC